MTSALQTRAIHALRKQIIGFDDGAYRDLLRAEFRVASSRDLDERGAGRLIERLKGLAGQGSGGAGARIGRRRPSARADAPMLQALWISLWNLGATRSKDDAALIAFVHRQTGGEHPRFLTPPQLSRVVEALKDWCAREGVNWREFDDPKRCVARAIVRKLVAAGAFEPRIAGDDPWPWDILTYGHRKCGNPANMEGWTPEHWDRLNNALGARLRANRAVAGRARANRSTA